MTPCELKDPAKDHPENPGNLTRLPIQGEDPPTKTNQSPITNHHSAETLQPQNHARSLANLSIAMNASTGTSCPVRHIPLIWAQNPCTKPFASGNLILPVDPEAWLRKRHPSVSASARLPVFEHPGNRMRTLCSTVLWVKMKCAPYAIQFCLRFRFSIQFQTKLSRLMRGDRP
jgi:hypothetical protein